MAEDARNTPTNSGTPGDGKAPARQVNLQRIYCKDASLEVPLAPQVFTREWKPEINVSVNTNVDKLDNDFFQVVLVLTVTAKLGEDTAYLAESHQAGIFQILGFDQEAEVRAILGAYCPSVIFPFARETIADLVQRGGFPQLLLQPINFDLLYAQHLEQQNQGSAANDAPGASNSVN